MSTAYRVSSIEAACRGQSLAQFEASAPASLVTSYSELGTF